MTFYIGTTDKVVLIMTGIGGSETGYNDKYLRIAERLNKDYGASVFIFATPLGAWSNGDALVDTFVADATGTLEKHGIVDFDLYAMGSSAGASLLGAYSYKHERIKKLLLVNPVIQINVNKLLNGLNKSNAKITVAFGELDPSYQFVSMLESVERSDMEIISIEGVDHNFSGEKAFEIFLDLPEVFFTE